jgi:serine/threonine-protein kinase
MIGKPVGKYRIIEKLGRGGMGVVYKAIDETLDRVVAIKTLNPDLLEDEAIKRFRAEAVTVARLNHPRIAAVYELTREADSLLMVMEFVSGETFEHLVTRTRRLPIDHATHGSTRARTPPSRCSKRRPRYAGFDAHAASRA